MNCFQEIVMPLGFNIGNILQQYTGLDPKQAPANIDRDFDEIAQHSPHDDLADGIGEAFRSDQTPPFGNMVSQLFNQGNAQEKSGMLNQLLGSLGPSGISSLLGSGLGGGALGGLLSRFTGHQQRELAPEDVENLSPDEVQELADRAEKQNPGIIDQMSRFYAQTPTLVKGLGGAALAIALAKMSQRNR
jgi:hypothetical protein